LIGYFRNVVGIGQTTRIPNCPGWFGGCCNGLAAGALLRGQLLGLKLLDALLRPPQGLIERQCLAVRLGDLAVYRIEAGASGFVAAEGRGRDRAALRGEIVHHLVVLGSLCEQLVAMLALLAECRLCHCFLSGGPSSARASAQVHSLTVKLPVVGGSLPCFSLGWPVSWRRSRDCAEMR
jgi:hypothetical protein